MGTVRTHIPVKLVVGLFSRVPAKFAITKNLLKKKFGAIDEETPFIDFDSTEYYNRELGSGLKRKFISFAKLITIENSHSLKLFSNKIEKRLAKGASRTINIDPGYLTLASLILLTTKNRSHRIYINSGIFADLELVFMGKTFRPLEWTYPDYKKREYIVFFNSVRQKYLSQVKKYL